MLGKLCMFSFPFTIADAAFHSGGVEPSKECPMDHGPGVRGATCMTRMTSLVCERRQAWLAEPMLTLQDTRLQGHMKCISSPGFTKEELVSLWVIADVHVTVGDLSLGLEQTMAN